MRPRPPTRPAVTALLLAVLGAGQACSLLLDKDTTQCASDVDCADHGAVCDRATFLCTPEVIVTVTVSVHSPRDAGGQDAADTGGQANKDSQAVGSN